jgi:hypothetical protein
MIIPPTAIRAHGAASRCKFANMPTLAGTFTNRVFYRRWFFCANDQCVTREVMPERYKVTQPVTWGDSWDDFDDANLVI